MTGSFTRDQNHWSNPGERKTGASNPTAFVSTVVSWQGWLLAWGHKEACGRSEGQDGSRQTMVKKQSRPGSCASGHGVAVPEDKNPIPKLL